MRGALRTAGLLGLELLVCGLLACGDDDKTTDQSSGQIKQYAPVTAAALTDPNAIYNVTPAGADATTLRFPASGRYQEIISREITALTVNGTVSNLRNNGNTWTATLTPDPNQFGAQSIALTLTWTGENTGTFTFLPQGAAAQSGSFTVSQAGTTSGGGGSTNNPGGAYVDCCTTNYPGHPLVLLVGRTLQLNYQPGGERFLFTSMTAASYEDGIDSATYQYDTATGQLNIKRSGGQTYHLILTPGATSGSTMVIYQEPGSSPTASAATYTLQ